MRSSMRRIFVAGLALVAASPLVLPAVSGAAVAGTAQDPGTGWGVWESEALAAVAGYRGGGPLTAGEPEPGVSSTVATPSGPLAVAQRWLVASDAAGKVLIQTSVLGQTQVVVTELSLTASGQPGATLVLQSGSSAVAGTYPHTATGSTAAQQRSGRHDATDADVHRLGPGGHLRPVLTVTGGCRPKPQTPFVFSSSFGPLVDGEGLIKCTTAETLSLIVSIYRGLLTHVGTTAAGSSGSAATSYSLNSYYFCTAIPGTHDFRTSEIWGVNGTDEGGATSSEAALHCT